ncbi:hypothetical protein B0T13DRAFT_509048 [Neurospora crassa]|nr:hypothetical protein B0T13DRAFT_509048 [Neurospora crassa]
MSSVQKLGHANGRPPGYPTTSVRDQTVIPYLCVASALMRPLKLLRGRTLDPVRPRVFRAPPKISDVSPKNAVPCRLGFLQDLLSNCSSLRDLNCTHLNYKTQPWSARPQNSFSRLSPATAPADLYESYTDPVILPSWLQQQQQQVKPQELLCRNVRFQSQFQSQTTANDDEPQTPRSAISYM